MRTYVTDERRYQIGYIDDNGGNYIDYHHMKAGFVGRYDRHNGVYTRMKGIPGRPAPFPNTGDYGESDIRYWESVTR